MAAAVCIARKPSFVITYWAIFILFGSPMAVSNEGVRSGFAGDDFCARCQLLGYPQIGHLHLRAVCNLMKWLIEGAPDPTHSVPGILPIGPLGTVVTLLEPGLDAANEFCIWFKHV